MISFLFSQPSAGIGELVVDAFVRESHEFFQEITEHPVENGATLVDHVHRLPMCLSLEGIITNTPMTFMGITLKSVFEPMSNNIVDRAFSQLELIFSKREPIFIATSLKVYPDMVIEHLSVERGGGESEVLHFFCTAKQIQFAKKHKIAVSVPQKMQEHLHRTAPKETKGLQESKTVSPQKAQSVKKDSSFLFQMLGGGT